MKDKRTKVNLGVTFVKINSSSFPDYKIKFNIKGFLVTFGIEGGTNQW